MVTVLAAVCQRSAHGFVNRGLIHSSSVSSFAS